MKIITALFIPHNKAEYKFDDGFTGICWTGWVYKDSKKRFKDGQFIRTSPIVEEDSEFIFTENSIYKIVTDEEMEAYLEDNRQAP